MSPTVTLKINGARHTALVSVTQMHCTWTTRLPQRTPGRAGIAPLVRVAQATLGSQMCCLHSSDTHAALPSSPKQPRKAVTLTQRRRQQQRRRERLRAARFHQPASGPRTSPSPKNSFAAQTTRQTWPWSKRIPRGAGTTAATKTAALCAARAETASADRACPRTSAKSAPRWGPM